MRHYDEVQRKMDMWFTPKRVCVKKVSVDSNTIQSMSGFVCYQEIQNNGEENEGLIQYSNCKYKMDLKNFESWACVIDLIPLQLSQLKNSLV